MKKFFRFVGILLIPYFIYVYLFAIEPIIMGSIHKQKPCPTISFPQWKILQCEVNKSHNVVTLTHAYLTYPGVKMGQWFTQALY